MIKCKEDLMDTFIVNDKGVLRDTYLALCEKFGIKWFSGTNASESCGQQLNYDTMKVNRDLDLVSNNSSGKQIHLSDLIDLENSKVYTTDEEVIRKYAELCGREFKDSHHSRYGLEHEDDLVGVSISDENGFVDWFSVDSEDNCGGLLAAITVEQINALYADKFGQTETPEEAEAFGDMDRLNEQQGSNASEWNGEGLPPVGAIFCTEPHFDIQVMCKYSSKFVVVGEMLPFDRYKGIEVVIENLDRRTFRKPETESERNDRERMEAAYDLYVIAQLAIDGDVIDYSDFVKESRQMRGALAIIDKTGYRKSTN